MVVMLDENVKELEVAVRIVVVTLYPGTLEPMIVTVSPTMKG